MKQEQRSDSMSQLKYKRIMLKVSGEALAGANRRGLDFDVINSVCRAIKECTELGVFRDRWCYIRRN